MRMIRGWSGTFRGLTAFLFAGALFTGAAVAAMAQAAQTFSVRLSNFTIAGAPAQVRAGTPITFNASSTGLPHNLAIDGSGVDLRPSTPNLMDGQSGAITFPALQPGTYSLYCPVGMHRANGMQTTLTVVAAGNLPATGGFAGTALPAGLALAGLATAGAGVLLRRRSA
jgi:plastocyanin